VLTVTVVTYLLNRDKERHWRFSNDMRYINVRLTYLLTYLAWPSHHRDRRINAPVAGDVSVHRWVHHSSSTLRLLTSQLVPALSHAVGPPTSPGPADSAVDEPASDWSTALNNYQSPL